MVISMIINNGEGATGYEFMHGTNDKVGGFQIQGIVSKNTEGDTIYDLTYTWNDIMDPFPEMYDSDAAKAELAKQIPFANPRDYNFHISWHDKTVLYQQEIWYKRNDGWLKNWSSDWYDNLSDKDKDMYMKIDYEQISNNFNFMKWKDYVERIKQEYAQYYICQ